MRQWTVETQTMQYFTEFVETTLFADSRDLTTVSVILWTFLKFSTGPNPTHPIFKNHGLNATKLAPNHHPTDGWSRPVCISGSFTATIPGHS